MPSLSDFGTKKVEGVIKRYNKDDKYGFIQGEPNERDIFFHLTTFASSGFEGVPATGGKATLEVVAGPKGPVAVRFLAYEANPTRVEDMEPDSEWERCMVKWFNDIKGFGFLIPQSGGTDIFLHVSTLRSKLNLEIVNPGDVLWVRWATSGKGRIAADLRR